MTGVNQVEAATLRIDPDGEGSRLWLKVVPGARRARVVGALGDRLKVAVSQPPEGGAANRAVVALLAETLGVAVVSVEIVQGHADPRKAVRVAGLSPDELRHRLAGVG